MNKIHVGREIRNYQPRVRDVARVDEKTKQTRVSSKSSASAAFWRDSQARRRRNNRRRGSRRSYFSWMAR